MVNASFVTRLVCAMGRSGIGGRRMQSPNRPSLVKTWEKWMKLVKISTIAFAMAAMLAGPVLAQGVSSDTQIRGGAQGRSNMPGGASGSSDEDMGLRAGAPGEKSGVNAKAGAKGTVGSGSGAHRGTGNAVGDPASGSKR